MIHTKVEMIECTIPRKVLRFSIDPAEMSRAKVDYPPSLRVVEGAKF